MSQTNYVNYRCLTNNYAGYIANQQAAELTPAHAFSGAFGVNATLRPGRTFLPRRYVVMHLNLSRSAPAGFSASYTISRRYPHMQA